MDAPTADRHPIPAIVSAPEIALENLLTAKSAMPREARKESLSSWTAKTVQRNSQTFFASFAAFLCGLSG